MSGYDCRNKCLWQ